MKILKTVLSKFSIWADSTDYDIIHFVPYDIAHIVGEELYRQQILKQNEFLHNLVIIPVLNIDTNILYGNIIPKSRLIVSIKGIERTCLSQKKINGF